jgi:flagellar basal body rod protein FlgF
MPYDVQVTIATDGTITARPINDNDYPQVREHLIKLARAVGGEAPVVEVNCITPDETEAIAQRLAALLLRTGSR